MAVPRPLAGRYAFSKRIRGTQRTIIWIARDSGTGSLVVASVLPAPRAAGLSPLIGLEHPHLATVIDSIGNPAEGELPDGEALPPDSSVIVAEHVDGRSLQQRLDAGPVSVESAVEWTIAAADALAALHARGGVHGALSPRALIVIRPGDRPVPVVTHLLVPPSGAYCSPERVTGGGPSAEDDTWALIAALYTALTRRPPFHGGSRTELARAIVAGGPPPPEGIDPDLAAILTQGLMREAVGRLSSAAAFRVALEEWVERTGARSQGDFAPVAALVSASEPPPNVGDLSLVAALARPDSPEATAPLTIDPSMIPRPNSRREQDPERVSIPFDIRAEAPPLSTEPEPEPEPPLQAEPTPPTPMSTTAVAPTLPQRKLSLPLALLGVAAASAAIGLVAGRLKHAGSPARETPGAAAVLKREARTPPPTAATDPAPEASGAPAEPVDGSACVASALPAGTVGDLPDVGYLCTDKDLWGIGRRFDLVVAKKGQGPGMLNWMHLGRFDLAALAILRERCCPGSVPFTAATPKGACDTLEGTLHAVGRDPSPVNADAYGVAAGCVMTRQIRYPNEWWDRIGPQDARTSFDQFLASLRVPR